MSFIESFWETYGDNEVTFVKYDLNKITVTLSEAREFLQTLGKDQEDSFLCNTISHTINRLIREFGNYYFPPFKCCIFEPRFSFNNGDEQYSLTCIFNMNVWDIQTDNIEETYEFFKSKVLDGSIRC